MNYEFPQDENKPEREPTKLERGIACLPNNSGKAMEDAHIDLLERGFFAVFDGAGGQGNGEEASALAQESVLKSLESLSEPKSSNEAQDQLEKILSIANRHIIEKAESDKSRTTALMIRFWQNDERQLTTVISVGDSRVYLLRNSRIQCLTLDDGLLTHSLIDQGKSKEYAKKQQDKLSNATSMQDLDDDMNLITAHYEGNIVPNLLGKPSSAVTDRSTTIETEEKDIFLLCSDGISDNLTENEIASILTQDKSSQKLADEILSQARKHQSDESRFRRNSYTDDATAIVIRVTG